MSRANIVLTEDEISLVNDCAARLRVIQSDAAAIDPEKRCEYLSEEIGRSFKNLTPAARKISLEALLSRFPVAGQLAGDASLLSVPPPVVSVAPPPLAPEQLIELLISVADDLSAAQRTQFVERLRDAGFVPANSGNVKLKVSREMQTSLGLATDQQPDLERVVQLAALVVQALYELDRTAMIALNELFPRATLLSRAHNLRHSAGQYLTGGLNDIEPHLRITSTLLAGMMAAALGGGRDFGRQFVEKYSPAAIEEVIGSEGRAGFMGPNKKERCWDKYCSLSKDIATPELVDRWVKDCLGRFADSGTKNIR